MPITNPGGAFGYAVTDSPAGWGQFTFKAAAVLTAGNVVALHTDGSVTVAATNVTSNKIMGIALDNAVTNGTVRVAVAGPVVAQKGNANFAAGDYCAVDSTTAGVVGALAGSAAVTQVKDLGQLVGQVIATATTGATTVNIFLLRSIV